MKLKEKQVTKIKELIAEGKLTQPEIAKKFKVSRSLVSDIATGRVHKDSDDCLPHKQQGGQHKVLAQYDPTNERILELESEIVHLTDERNNARRQVKATAKTHGLFRAIADEMELHVKPMTSLPSLPLVQQGSKPNKVIEEHLVIHLSDMHADQIVRPIECGGLEEYNFPIAVARGEHYIDTILKWSQSTLAGNFVFPSATVLAYGDFTSGEIHGHTERSYFRNQFKNSLAIGQLQALMFRDLAPYFKILNVVYVSGNHGRRSIKKDYGGPQDNWDFLVAQAAQLYCQDISNIHFVIPEAFSINLDINGVGFAIAHGDDCRSTLGVPFYGLERRQQRIMALNGVQNGTRIRYYVIGHFHRPSSLAALDGEVLINGAWLATDSYAYNSLAAFTEPMQLIHGVHPKHGISWRLPVKLKFEGEKKGPKRYKIDLMDEIGL
jgi:transposase